MSAPAEPGHVQQGGATAPRILLAEDDDEFRRLLATALAREGYDVSALATGVALLEAMQEVVRRSAPMPALMLSDQRMPGGVRGLKALQRARDLGWTVPLILITAFEDDEVLEEAFRSGVVVIRKPFDVDDVCTMVRFLTANPGSRPLG